MEREAESGGQEGSWRIINKGLEKVKFMTEEQKKTLERQLWGVANVLRGKMNADEYKNYILGFIFYKYLSEKLERYVDAKLLVRDKIKFSEIKENTKEGKEYLSHTKKACIDELGFFLRPTELFSYLVKKGRGEIKNEKTFIIEDLKNILNDIEKTSAGTASEDDFKGLFDDMDLTSTKLGSREGDKNEVVVEVLTLLDGIDFKLEDAKSDLLGDAYEYLIGEFAAGAGKKGGEFYTPAQVSRLLAQIVSQDKKRIRSVYDPTCGSGSLLLRIGDYADVVNYFGQELNPTTYNLARMNMILHGVHFDHFRILQGDTLKEDMHTDLQAEAIVANPPFSAQWKGDTDPQLAHDDRFSQYGRLAPKSAADYAFVTHMLYHLADNGTMAVVLPHGALFRSGAEGHIRKYIIEKQNYLDAVIGLPSNLFYGTSIPATVLVFKKCRREDENILFIDASKEFEKGKNQNKLTNENIGKIFETYKKREEIEKYSHLASLDEIRENEFNLNIPRYVDTFEEEEIIDIKEVAKNLKKLNADEVGLQEKIARFCDELEIDVPF
jgi:type I restriction enzyme M protein